MDRQLRGQEKRGSKKMPDGHSAILSEVSILSTETNIDHLRVFCSSSLPIAHAPL